MTYLFQKLQQKLARIILAAPRSTFLLLCLLGLTSACVSTPTEQRRDAGTPVSLPFMRTESSECYYLDDFMPTPDSLVTGKNAGVYLRYYTYKTAYYKAWEKEKVMLAFYSRDTRCWSLFEEYVASGFSLNY